MEKIILGCESFGNGELWLYLEDGKVILEYSQLFDADTDDSCHAYGIIPVEKYKNGIRQFREFGYCSIKGDECSLEMNKREDGKIRLNFSGSGYANNVFVPELDWSIERLYKPFEDM